MHELMITAQVPATLLVRDGVRYEFTGDYRPPNADEFYLCGDTIAVAFDGCVETSYIMRPVWQPPEFAKKIGGWMFQNRSDACVTFTRSQPMLQNGSWPRPMTDQTMSVRIARAIGLYPPHWEGLPGDQRIVFLGETNGSDEN